MAPRDWDDAFGNMGHVAGSSDLPKLWAQRASAYRKRLSSTQLDVAYGAHPREVFDLLVPDESPKGVALFEHGGFWLRLDKSFWSYLAEGMRAQGWAVCLPSYCLAPEMRIADITRQIGVAIEKAASIVDGPLHICGHSAGGHLVTRMICDEGPRDRDVRSRIAVCLSISGLHDLRPLMKTAMNTKLRLDQDEARAESPALREPIGDVAVTCWVGGGERPEFIRQSELLAKMWGGLDCNVKLKIDGTHNHFTVLDALENPNSDLISAWCGTKS